MESALGPTYARTWAREHVLAGLHDRTVLQALDSGWEPKAVWREVWRELQLPARDR
jgi:hypothetical protein